MNLALGEFVVTVTAKKGEYKMWFVIFRDGMEVEVALDANVGQKRQEMYPAICT